MRKFVSIVFLLFAVNFISAQGKEQLLTVIFTNDSHGMAWQFDEPNNPGIGGLAAQKTIIDMIRAEVQGKGGNVIILSAGDITLGDPRSNVCENMPFINGMNLIGYDALTIGNHEFDFGLEVFHKMKNAAKFPFLSANIYEEGGTKAVGKDYLEKKFDDGLKVAVLGLTTRETEVITGAGLMGNLVMTDPIIEAKTRVPFLRKNNDIVIVLSHLGFYETDKSFDGYYGDNYLPKVVPGIDLIVGGHTQKHLTSPVKIGDTHIVQTEGLGKWVGRFDIYMKDKKIVKTDHKLYPVNLKEKKIKDDKTTYELTGDSYAENKAMLDMLNGFKCTFPTKQIGKIDRDLIGDRELSRTQETELGNIITDVMREKTGADVAFMNSGSIRQGLEKGVITEKDIYSVFPFMDTVFIAELTGYQLQEVLDIFAEKGQGSPGFLQISGIGVKLFKGSALEITVNGKPLDKKRKYKVAFNSFISGGGDGYTVLKNITAKKDTGYCIPSILVENLKIKGTFAKPAEGRIKIVK
ncbi:MAG TPA: 5'-nucleotidase C-terminal domain-containing protein [bacterium]|nr:5'-nucleotidase C-terminal domain-containing protein [bacterium]